MAAGAISAWPDVTGPPAPSDHSTRVHMDHWPEYEFLAVQGSRQY